MVDSRRSTPEKRRAERELLFDPSILRFLLHGGVKCHRRIEGLSSAGASGAGPARWASMGLEQRDELGRVRLVTS